MSASLETLIGYQFKDKSLLSCARTHSSTGQGKNYERLEFLGDRVLGLAVAEMLYKKFPHEAEGDMAKRLAALVQGEMLAQIAKEIELGQYIILSDSEAAAGGAENDNILADVLEAILGALYLEAGFSPCQNLIAKLWGDHLDTISKPPQHPKTKLQEWSQGMGLPLPEYQVVGQTGPDHAPCFEVHMILPGHPPSTATGKSRQEAEKLAAQSFIKRQNLS